MSKETLDVVQESWRRSRRSGAVMGELFRLNLRRINPALTPIESKTTKNLLDLLLLQAIDEVVKRLDDKQELVCALRNFCYLFELTHDRRKEIEHISQAILLTIEQVMADYFTLQLHVASNLISERFADVEVLTQKKSNCGKQLISYIQILKKI